MKEITHAWHVFVATQHNWKLFAYWLGRYAPKLEEVK